MLWIHQVLLILTLKLSMETARESSTSASICSSSKSIKSIFSRICRIKKMKQECCQQDISEKLSVTLQINATKPVEEQLLNRERPHLNQHNHEFQLQSTRKSNCIKHTVKWWCLRREHQTNNS